MPDADCVALFRMYAPACAVPDFLCYQEFNLCAYHFNDGRMATINPVDCTPWGRHARLDGCIMDKQYNPDWNEWEGGQDD